MSGEKVSCYYQSKEKPQDFHKLRDQCLKNCTLFEDPEFPALDSSLFITNPDPLKRFEWKRPKDIVKNPQFIVDVSRFDVHQGKLGNCWFLAAMANLTLCKLKFLDIVLDDQRFDNDYAGIFHFRFWQYNRWIEVVIDDRLPTYKGKLIYVHSTEDNEFWCALLEKAYAKLHGCYQALNDGFFSEAMIDFTGGVSEMYNVRDIRAKDLFNILSDNYNKTGVMMGVSKEAPPHVPNGTKTSEDLIEGHVYSITNVQEVSKHKLLRLRNPWGNEFEWNGSWHDSSSEWDSISETLKNKLDFKKDKDGEFWMSVKDFKTRFDHLEICHLNPDSLIPGYDSTKSHNKKWLISQSEGKWVPHVSAGGRNGEKIWCNPQYRITLETDEGSKGNVFPVIITLTQKNRRRCGKKLLNIGFKIYRWYKPDQFLINKSPEYKPLRDLSYGFQLNDGIYCIVPSTEHANEEGEFLLRVMSQHQSNLKEIKEETGLKNMEYKQTSLTEIEENEILELFTKEAGQDGEVNWKKLQEIFLKKETKGFSEEVCCSMIAMLDNDKNGTLNFEEFKRLWGRIRQWESVFKTIDTDKDGTLRGFELKDALNAAGYKLDNDILTNFMRMYGNRAGEIKFDDFIMCAIKARIIIDSYKSTTNDDACSATSISSTMENVMEMEVCA